MNSILLYFLKSGIAMALFYGVYRIFMEKETNYSLNRYYLLVTMILSMVLPVLPVEKLFIVEKAINIPVVIKLGEQTMASAGIEVSTGSGFQLSGFSIARIIYICGISILVCTLLFQLCRLLLIRKAGKDKYGSLRLIFVNQNITPFSILNRVYLNKELRRDPKMKTILDHEYAHFRSLHYIDLIIFEFITIFQWFNPLTWLFVRSLKEVHEFQADAAVLRGGVVTGSYQALLVNQLTGTEVFRLTSGFSKSLTKKRMIMMTKIKSKKGAWLKALLAVPALAILLFVFAANSPSGQAAADGYIVKGKVIEAASGEALPGVSVILKGTTKGSVTDINGDFVLEVEDRKPVVVYSFVGFETASTKGNGSFTVKMKRKTYEIREINESTTTESDTHATDGEVKEIAKKEASKETASQDDPPGKGQVFLIVEDMPKFQGKSPHNTCIKWVREQLEYPQEAKDKGLEGTVYVQFVVDTKGKVGMAKVKKSIDPLLDKAALKAVNAMPDWTPGSQRGKPVAVRFEIPVEFKL